MMKIEDFADFMKVDRLDLDSAATVQAQLYFEASQSFAEALYDRDAAKSELNKLEARLYEEIAGAGEKLSDSRIRSQILLSPERESVEIAYMSAKEMADRWSGVVQALSERGSVIRKLADLYATDYFATSPPKSSNGAGVARRNLSR